MNDGFINEDALKEYINNNVFSSYNNNIKEFLKFTFGSEFDPVKSFKVEKKAGQAKPDLVIFHNGTKKYVSVKKGSGNSVHQEKIIVFFPVVERLLGSEVLNCLKMFHYGDDTLDDSGSVRYDAKQAKIRYAKEVAFLNKKFNESDKLSIFFDRFLFIGNVETDVVDVVYHGTIETGLWASRDEIVRYIKSHSFDQNSTVHFGPLSYQVWGRDEKRKAVHPERRYVMQVKWSSIKKDLENIRKENK